jgi:hypothetical protein
MLNARCQLRTFTFYLSMTGNPVLSVGDIAKETGLSRQRIWQLAVTGGIPAERANPGGKQHRFIDSPSFAEWRKEKARQSARRRAGQVRRPYRVRRAYLRRQEKIEKLHEILVNETEVSASDKEVALWYYRCLFTLWWARVGMSLREWPLLEGIHALYESKIIFGRGLKIDHYGIEETIERLPTYSETTPQTEQSSLNVSA